MTEIPYRYAERLQEFGIVLGASRLFPDYPHLDYLDVTDMPHVFFAKSLYLLEPATEIAKLGDILQRENIILTVENIWVGQQYAPAIAVQNVMVMLGHGVVIGPEEQQWIFRATKRSVSETVDGYNSVARDLSWAPLDIVVSCREGLDGDHESGVNITFNYRYGNAVIYPSSLAAIKNNPIQAHLIEGEGASLVAQADQWNALTWFRTWVKPQNSFLRQYRSVPTWAKQFAS